MASLMPFTFNIWFTAAAGLMVGLIPCLIVILRAELMEAVVAMQLASTLGVLIVLLLSQGYGRPSFADLSLALAFLSLPSGLLFAHFFERWL
jgi:multisubunit Na+/H+ antiporter MnhF subunit